MEETKKSIELAETAKADFLTASGSKIAYKPKPVKSLPELFSTEGQEFISFQTDTNLLRSLMSLQSSHFQMTLIEAVHLKSLEDFDSLETLWEIGDLFQE